MTFLLLKSPPDLNLPATVFAPNLTRDISHAVTYVDSSPNMSNRDQLGETISTGIVRSSSGAPSELDVSFPPLVPEHADAPIPPIPALDAVSMTETETELETDLADDPSNVALPESPPPSSDDGGDTLDDSRFFAEPSWEATARSPPPAPAPPFPFSTDDVGLHRQTRDIAAIELELARIRDEEARRAREAEELRESIAMLQRVHLRGNVRSDDEE